MSKRPCMVFLYTELAEYIRVCFDALAHAGVAVHVFHFPINPEAPFAFDLSKGPVHYHNRENYTPQSLLRKVAGLSPQVVVCSGWVDRGYIQTIKRLKGKSLRVLALDSQLQGGLKANLSRLRAKWWYRPLFDYAWVPGEPQVQYVQSLGFAPNQIYTGFYTADSARLSRVKWNTPEGQFPKRMVFFGRYVDFKGVKELWAAWGKLEKKGWELHCAGTGPLYESRVKSASIRHLGFVQPTDLDTFVSQGGVFVLPSHKEPWGVVVHEFASAGYPLICTWAVGAASAFLRAGQNGFLVAPQGEMELTKALNTCVNTSAEDLFRMGAKSRELAQCMTVEKWVEVAQDLLNKNES